MAELLQVQNKDDSEQMMGTEKEQLPPSAAPVDHPPAYYPAPSQWQPTTQPQLQPQYMYQPYGYPPHPAGGMLQQQSNNNVVVVQQPGYTNVAAPPRPNDYLGLSIFACLCCCWPIAIVALVHSCQVNDRYIAGDYAGAVNSSQQAKHWSKVSIIVGSVLSAVWFAIVLMYIIIQIVFVAAANA